MFGSRLIFIFGIVYGLAAAVFTQNLNRAIETAHKLQAGTAWVSFLIFIYLEKKRKQYLFKTFRPSPLLQGQLYQVPFGGFKQSGIGREMGEYALEKYVNYFLHTVDLPFYSLSALCFSSFSQLYKYQICTHQPRTPHVKNKKEISAPRCISIFFIIDSRCINQEIE